MGWGLLCDLFCVVSCNCPRGDGHSGGRRPTSLSIGVNGFLLGWSKPGNN